MRRAVIRSFFFWFENPNVFLYEEGYASNGQYFANWRTNSSAKNREK